MASIEKALQIAALAHEGQKDKEGLAYILHPLRVMSRVNGEEAQIVAILHDVVEDTPVSIDDLEAAGFNEVVLEALECVTHQQEESYADYVVRCKANAIARQVKLADLEDNTLLSRTILRRDRLQGDLARIHRYALAYKFLTDQISETEYRERMVQGITPE